MNKVLVKSAAFLMMLAMLLGCIGCGTVTDKLDSFFKEETESPNQGAQEEAPIEMPAKTKENYTILILTEAVEASELDNVMLLSFNTAKPSISVLQLPTDLFLHVSERSVEGLFKARYDRAINDGKTEKEAATEASEALVDVLSTGFNAPINYYINFSATQLAAFINTLGGVQMDLPFSMGGLKMGAQTLKGNQALEYLAYDSYSQMPQSYLDARKLLTVSIFNKAIDSVDAEMLSLFVMELRTVMTTNIPSAGGEDIFFVRKWLQTKPEAFKIANVSTQTVYIASEASRVLQESSALTQMNELLGIYEEELTQAQFDPRFVFVDYSNDVVKSVYGSTAPKQPTTYTAQQILSGRLVLKK